MVPATALALGEPATAGAQADDEFVVTGTFKGWDRWADLPKIKVPTLVSVGRHDEMRPSHMQHMQSLMPDAELVVFEESSHMAFVEEREAYIATMNGFLDRVEAASV